MNFVTNFFKKSLLGTIILIGIFTVIPEATHAASFSFTITPPFAGSMESTSLIGKTNTSRPYVNPSHSTTPTSYFLSPKRESSTQATSLISNISTSGTRNMSYLSGYGGTGQKYCLSAYPTNYDFATYKISGTWAP